MADIQAINAWLRDVKVTAKRSKHSSKVPTDPPAAADDDDDIRYPVEAVLDEVFDEGRRFLLVQWVGFDEPSWEPIENVDQCDELLKLFNKEADQGFDELELSFDRQSIDELDESLDED